MSFVMISLISILNNLFRFQSSECKYWKKKYKEWDEEGEEIIKYYCNPVLKLIDEETIDVRGLRYYTYHIQSYKWYKCSEEIKKVHKETLLKIWEYAMKKGYIDDGVDYDTFSTSSVAILKEL